MPVRILLVDDFTPWRLKVRSLIERTPDWKVIAEGADGQVAVQKAQEVQPDLILLDIRIPTLSGIEAAKQIRRVARAAKIIFVSQMKDNDVVEAALAAGAQGYVCKIDAPKELVTAIATVLGGGTYVSKAIKGGNPDRA